ncbi:hypothetical protein Nepgr_008629 [Nepenthes gracilis]|uniref:Pentatricopeptide repeat-containing protein n=1 Tax=Nepenthes gracilis TaxID=150966 RepID=A0AAD3S9P0_NEPGR|nr:hypothetical protein Nepgr_008629 [Nepenthes gracilis]
MKGYCREGKWIETLSAFRQMLVTNEKPNNYTVPVALRACAGLGAIELGLQIHGLVKKNGKMNENLFVGSALIELYSTCGKMADSLRVFNDFSRPDVVMWTSMVNGYQRNGDPERALDFFSLMAMDHLDPDEVTLISIVGVCAQLGNLGNGKCLHGFLIKRRHDKHLSLLNSLLNFYGKTNSVNSAANLFRTMEEKDVITWSTMITAYGQNGHAVEALNLFHEMTDERVEYNSVTVITALQACAATYSIEEGKRIHELAAKKGLESDVSVSNALLDMYMKCSSPEEAVDLFQRMPKKNVVSWSVLISGYTQNGRAYESVRIFRHMLSDGNRPDAISLVKVLTASSELGILQQALCLHGYVVRNGFNDNIFVGASLIELYSKCGSLENATKIFEGAKVRDVVIWSSMIAGYGIHGQGVQALKTYDQMVKGSAVQPNSVTFLSILSACSHAGLVKEGLELFNRMVCGYKLTPNADHYGITVDLLGRIGELDKAMDIICRMPIPAEPHVWGALLGACRIYNNIELGEIAAKNLFPLDPNHAGYYMLLANMYALDGKWHNVADLRAVVKKKGLKKFFGHSAVEIRKEVHCFLAGDRSHPELQHIYEFLKNLEMAIREEGDVAAHDFLLPKGEFH